MDGSIFNGIGSFIVTLMILAVVGILGTLGFGGYTLYKSFEPYKIIETRTLPEINWKLKASGQKVDTIWIYKFKQ